jgi:preprotein translocase subunit SecF
MDITWHTKHLKPRQMIAIPLVLAAVFAAVFLIRGVPMSIEFSSGTMITYRNLENSPNADAVESALSTVLAADVKAVITQDSAAGTFGLDIQTTKALDDNGREQVQRTMADQFGIQSTPEFYAIEPAISQTYLRGAMWAIILSFIAMFVIVLIVFRHRIVGIMLPCVALNMVWALGGLALFQMQFSLATLSGFLLMIGFSIDTNILLTEHLLRRVGGEPRERMATAMLTGWMITGTSLVTMICINILVTNAAITQLVTVLTFGLAGDLFNTWFLNGGVLIWYMERKKRKEYYVSL